MLRYIVKIKSQLWYFIIIKSIKQDSLEEKNVNYQGSIYSFYALMILEKKMNCILIDKLFEKWKKKSVKSHLIFLGEIFWIICSINNKKS